MALSLSKGQQISLQKTAGPSLTRVRMGLGWEGAKKKGLFGFGGGKTVVDLDANALLFDSGGQLVEAVWFRELQNPSGSVRHSGDNRTGEGEGDDETITVDLSRVPANVTTIIFSVNNYSGPNFAEVEQAYCRLVNVDGEKEIARYDLAAKGEHSALIMASLKRSGSDWTMTAIGQTSRGRTFHDNMGDIRPHV